MNFHNKNKLIKFYESIVMIVFNIITKRLSYVLKFEDIIRMAFDIKPFKKYLCQVSKHC